MGIISHSCMLIRENLQGMKRRPPIWLGLVSMLNWTALFLSVFLLSGCNGDKPQLYPNVTELEISEGEALEIHCTSNNYVQIYYPTFDYHQAVMMSDYKIYPEENSRSKTMLRESTVVGDTGWYGCANINKKISRTTSKDLSDPSISWMYVYIKSKKSAFIPSNWYSAVPPTECLPYFAIFPCRTTSPRINVTLTTSDPNLQEIVNRNGFFDPRIGFIVKNLTHYSTTKQFPSLTCKANNGDFTKKIMTFSKDYVRNCISEPTIKIEGKNKVFMGSTLSMTCTPSILALRVCKFHNQIQESQFSNVDLLISKLVIKNVTYEDEGNYTCQVKSSFNEHRSTNIFIELYDPNSFISLTSYYKEKAYSVGDVVVLTAYIDAYPEPILTWLAPNGTKIVLGKKFKMPFSAGQYPEYPESNLVIYGVEMEDHGIYTLQGEHSKHGMYSELTLNMVKFGEITCKACNLYACDSKGHKIHITDGVDDAPYGIIGPEEAYDGENVTLICAAVKHDYLSVTWLDDRFKEITNSAKVQVASTKTKFTIRKELVIYNISQSDEKDYYCSVSDIKLTGTISYHLSFKLRKDPYFIKDNMNTTSVIKFTTHARNFIHLYCFVGGTPAPNITWYKDDEPLNLPEDRFSLFSNDQKLIIRYLEEDDSGNYSCRAENRFGKVEKYQSVNVTDRRAHANIGRNINPSMTVGSSDLHPDVL
ncbi:vascular endothelial growth factor receptor kdr-like [Copidosoma floridanum]|uniref:vascular endothelial growth factor receptor kdr-like n=1 Tax=Copidosoma floridanum TaxID=29053 RepID=UPI000C6F7199|nr:vascular endothelial growth factor receptor kdr-like [Copidosoma floridanum]